MRPTSNSTIARRAIPPLVLIVAGLAAYANSFSGAFVLDDPLSIVNNPRIRHVWPLWDVLAHSSRPVIQLSLAVNYALGGLNIWGYHAFNLTVHLLAGLSLFGVVRRMLESPRLRARYGVDAPWLALAVALLWILHPLQTESVTYVIQRAEALMGLFFLLMLYCGIRGSQSPTPRFWYAAAVVACALGMGSKEVMVSAPLVMLLYDRIFIAGSFKEIFRQRSGFYAGLAATWLVLLASVATIPQDTLSLNQRPGAISSYAITQFGVIVHYLRLSVWPSPLVLDYGWPLADSVVEVLPSAAIVVLLLAATIWGLLHQHWIAFWGAWFCLVLAPTSTVLPVADAAVEHRMYLPLAAVMVVIVIGSYQLLGMAFARSGGRNDLRRWSGAGLLILAAVALGYTTAWRNEDYRSELAMWGDIVAKRPGNARAQYSLGVALDRQGRTRESIAPYMEAVRLRPDSPEAHSNLGVVLYREGRKEEGFGHLFEAVRLRPDFADGQNNLAVALHFEGRIEEAIPHYTEAIRLKPGSAEAHHNLGAALAKRGDTERAVPHFTEALRLKPDYAEAHNNLGKALLRLGRTPEAIAHFSQAVRLQPGFADARNNLNALQANPASREQATSKP